MVDQSIDREDQGFCQQWCDRGPLRRETGIRGLPRLQTMFVVRCEVKGGLKETKFTSPILGDFAIFNKENAGAS